MGIMAPKQYKDKSGGSKLPQQDECLYPGGAKNIYGDGIKEGEYKDIVDVDATSNEKGEDDNG